MRFLIVNADYLEFLDSLYAAHAGLARQPYASQLAARNESMFGVADFYSDALRQLGHEAWEVHANNARLQAAWALEHDVPLSRRSGMRDGTRTTALRLWSLVARTPLRRLKPMLKPVARGLGADQDETHDVLAAQVKHYRPDVLLNQAMDVVPGHTIRALRQNVRLVVGQIAARLPDNTDFSAYDLVVSSLPNLVDHFRSLGLPAELNRLAFDPRVLGKLGAPVDRKGISFVGTLSLDHSERMELLSHLCSQLDVSVWGQGYDRLPVTSPVRRAFRGRAWGLDMYRILRESRITLNHHGQIAGRYANNMRLYEATGVGTLLVTDWKENLGDMFEPGREVVTYRSAEECSAVIRYHLSHQDEAQAVARAGQARTLRDHTYRQRMEELVEIVQKRL